MADSLDYVERKAEINNRNKSASQASGVQARRKGNCGNFFSRCFQRCAVKIGPELDAKEGQHESEDRDSAILRSGSAISTFKALFQVSADNKLAWKFFGTKDNIVEEQMRQQVQYHWVIHPYSSFRWYWDFFMVLLLGVTVIALPVSISFYHDDKPISWFVLNCVTDFLFLVDLVFNFRTGVIVPKCSDQVILEPLKIAKYYMKGWFCLDLMSSIPFDYITLIVSAYNPQTASLKKSIIQASRALRVLRITKLLSLLRLLRISRLVRYVQRWEELFNLAGGVIRIVNLIGVMVLISHWNGCIQFLVPYLQGVPENSWIAINRLEDEPVEVQYTWALFKAMSHMLCIGYGRFPPQTVTEVWLTLLSMTAGATFYAVFIGNMSSLLMSSDSSGRLYREKCSEMEEYLRYRKVPAKIKQRIHDYYEHRYQRKFFDETGLLNNLSPPLRTDIVSHNCHALVKSVPFFQEADNEFLCHVLTKLTFEVYLPGDVIIQEGTAGDSMYFIQAGAVEVSTRDGSVETQLTQGSYFGEVCLLTDERRVATIRAVTTCDVFALHRSDFTAVVAEYPEVRHTMQEVAMQRLETFDDSRESSDAHPRTPPSSSDVNVLSQRLETAAAAAAADVESRRLASRAVTAAEVHRRISTGLQDKPGTVLPAWTEVDETDL